MIRPELLGPAILTIAVVAMGQLMLADHKGWRSPLPSLRLNPRLSVGVLALAALLVVLQALRFGGGAVSGREPMGERIMQPSGSASATDPIRALENTRRTLLKLVENIDRAIEAAKEPAASR